MSENGLASLPVVERGNPSNILGTLTLENLLQARTRHLEEDRERSRTLRIPMPFARPEPEELENLRR